MADHGFIDEFPILPGYAYFFQSAEHRAVRHAASEGKPDSAQGGFRSDQYLSDGTKISG
jgi:hypothetical protein